MHYTPSHMFPQCCLWNRSNVLCWSDRWRPFQGGLLNTSSFYTSLHQTFNGVRLAIFAPVGSVFSPSLLQPLSACCACCKMLVTFLLKLSEPVLGVVSFSISPLAPDHWDSVPVFRVHEALKDGLKPCQTGQSQTLSDSLKPYQVICGVSNTVRQS